MIAFLLFIFIVGLFMGWWDRLICKWVGGSDCSCGCNKKKSDK